jgi:hypothetical protein
LLDDISCFVHKQATHSFFKRFVVKDQTILTIDNYHRRITAAVSSFQAGLTYLFATDNTCLTSRIQISALLDVREWQRLNREAQAADQRALHARLLELETNQSKFLEALSQSLLRSCLSLESSPILGNRRSE